MLLNHSRTVVKLSDFGFSKVVEKRSRTSTVLGTPFYSAPEVLLHKPYDVKADVFSFGVFMFELISRRVVSIDRFGPREVYAHGIDVQGDYCYW
jgi:serine/threonine protein kinase